MCTMSEERAGDGLAPERSEDRLLLDEANHRVANEVAAALAALHLARNAKSPHTRQRMVDLSIGRLEAFGECCKFLNAGSNAFVNVGTMVEGVCRALVKTRACGGPSHVTFDICETEMNGDSARRIAMVAHELVTNALKHAFPAQKGKLEIRLERLAENLVLSVIDDGPGFGRGYASMTSGSRLGGSIVGELVRRGDGSMECDTGPDGTAIHVIMPVGAAYGSTVSAIG